MKALRQSGLLALFAILIVVTSHSRAEAQNIVLSSSITYDAATKKVNGVSQISMDYYTSYYGYSARIKAAIYTQDPNNPLVSKDLSDSPYTYLAPFVFSVQTQAIAAPGVVYKLKTQNYIVGQCSGGYAPSFCTWHSDNLWFSYRSDYGEYGTTKTISAACTYCHATYTYDWIWLGNTNASVNTPGVGPSPSPSPTTRPPAPTNVKATPDEEEIFLSWTPSQGAASYIIDRSGTPASMDGNSAESVSFAPISPNFFCDNITVPCVYSDPGLNTETTYSYVVSAANTAGVTSAEKVSAKPLPKPGCKSSATPRPNGGSPISDSHLGWSLSYSFTDRDGLKVSDIFLNGRKMAASISVPYFRLDTFVEGKNSISGRGELRPNGSSNADGSFYSRLIDYKITKDLNRFLLEANYEIDKISGTPKACLDITQKYEFFAEGPSNPPEWPGPCEPSESVVNCTKFRPMIAYSFHGGDKEHLRSLNIPQRHHYEISGRAQNSVGLFRDRDSLRGVVLNADGFFDRRNPLRQEFWQQAIIRGQNGQKWDNMHQTWKLAVKEPSVSVGGSILRPRTWYYIGPGCLECVHGHWRWGAFQAYRPFGAGYPLLPPAPGAAGGSDQSLDIAVVRWRHGEEHPVDYAKDLVQNESIADETSHDPVVFWYSPTGFKANDTFFWHSAWLNGRDPDKSTATTPLAMTESNSVSQDGPVSINLGDVFKEGSNNVGTYDLSTLGPLPAGYVALNNTAYLITTEALASGPFTIGFSAASVTDQSGFNNLRIFHAEPDPFDPEKPVWVNRTVLAPGSPAPDFSSKTISSESEDLGVYVIGNLIQVVPPSSDVANLTVTCSDSADPIVAGNEIAYTVTVANNGPQTAHEVALRDGLSPEAGYVSATATQGSCKEIDGTVYCSLGTINAGSSAIVTLVVKPMEGTGTFEPEGKAISNSPSVRAKETDADLGNNSATETTNILPNPNKAPSVSITSPLTGSLLVGPTNITISATAGDSDGTISKVEFFDNNELVGVGTSTGNNEYFITRQAASFGVHSLVAVATDNGGRQNISYAANVIVNGSATVSVTSPSSGALFAPGSSIAVSANAIHPSGNINKVEFFANGELLGLGTSNSPGAYSFLWNNVSSGIYSIVAVATEGSGITTTSASVNLTVGTPPTVTISSPADNTVFPPSTNISVSAIAKSSVGAIVKVDFFAGGALVGTASDVGTDTFTITWRNLADGFYSLTAVASDNLGITSTSPPIRIAVNTVPASGQLVWFDDALPQGATKHAAGDTDWYWVNSNPGALSGGLAHQSRNFAQLDLPNTSFHQHSFDGATQKLPVNGGDKLFTYVFLDINNMPREIMLQWNDGNNWEHRAYWGQNRIGYGIDGTSSRRYMGPLPAAGQWVRLEVPASVVGLEGSSVSGMAFALDAGRATFDLAGKTTANAPPLPTPLPNDFVWVDDAVPAGSILETVNDQWQWLAPHFCGQQGHRSYFTVNQGTGQFRSHSFRGAQTPMNVQPGDVLFTYVYLDANNMPDELVLQWHDGSGWEHRAYWGQNLFNSGITGTESRRYMGGVPPGNQWVRLEVPAGYVGLEGKAVTGMAFGFYSRKDHAGINWDCSGKASQLKTTPLPLSSITPLWRFVNNKEGPNKTAYAYFTNDQLGPSNYAARSLEGYVHPNQAAGTVPRYRFTQDNKYYYSTCPTCSTWRYDGVAFYLYPDSSTPGTVPVYEFVYSEGFMYSINLDDPERYRLNMTLTRVLGYVNATNPLVPAAPSFLRYRGVVIEWNDNSSTEAGFKIEYSEPGTETWTQQATVAANVAWFKPGNRTRTYRVRAFNSYGDSGYSNEACYDCLYPDGDVPPNTPPEITIFTPSNGETVPTDFVIRANAFDIDGNGEIAKVEFFAGSTKLGESLEAPYFFVWNNAPSGVHTLTCVATDAAGASRTSAPVTVTISALPVTSVTSPADGAVFGAPANIVINATASDSDGSITKVEFFNTDTKIGEDVSAPYSFTWSNVATGNYQLWSLATDNSGHSVRSAFVYFYVSSPPSVSITSPANGSVLMAPASATISASATDSDGSIAKVEFYAGTTLIGSDSTYPYEISVNGGGAGVYSLTAKATDDRGVTATSAPVTVTVSNPPGSAAIVFASNRDGRSQIYSMNSDGSDPVRWINSLANDDSPRWSPNHARIVFQSDRANPFSGVADVYVMNADGSGQTQLTTDAADDSAPVWSPDGTKIALQSARNGSYQVYVMNADGSGQANISNNATNDGQPSWSPDGTKIAFTSDRDHPGRASIYVMNADGSNQTRLTFSGTDLTDEQPSWSPDGTRIAFVSTRDSVVETWQETDDGGGILVRTRVRTNKEVYVMNANGTNQVRLTNTLENDDSPVWSRDGTKLLFRSDRERECCDPVAQVWVMNVDGTNLLNLSNGGFGDYSASW